MCLSVNAGGGGFTVKIAQRRGKRGGIVANERLLPERHGRIPDRDAERGERFLVRTLPEGSAFYELRSVEFS